MTELQQIAADLGAMHDRIRVASNSATPDACNTLRDANRSLLQIIRAVEVAALIERDYAPAGKEG